MVLSVPRDDSRAQPKSSRRTEPCSSIRLSGLISRWISPALCMALSAVNSGSISGKSSEAGILPPRRAARSMKLVPSTYSMTMYAVLLASK